MKLLAMDFGGSSVKYSLIDEEGRRSQEGQDPAPLSSPAQFRELTGEIFDRFRGEAEGVAISMPGFINGNTGYLRTAGAYLSMYGVRLYELLAPRIPVPVTVENDGKCAAYAELWAGSLRGVKEAAVVILGTGIAGGVIHDGRILRGFSGTAGEFSFMGLPTSLKVQDSLLFRCSMAGLTLTAARRLGVDLARCPYAGLAGLFGVENGALGPLDRDPRFANGVDGRLFFALLEEGNPIAAELYEEYTASVAQLLLSVQCVTDPEYIALGGGVTRQPRVITDVEAQLRKYDAILDGNALPVVRLRPTEVKGSPNELGAAYNFYKQQGIL